MDTVIQLLNNWGQVFRTCAIILRMGTLSNDDDNGCENITKKINLRPFKIIYRLYLEPLNSSNLGHFSWSSILKGFIHVQLEKGKFVVVCPRPP